MQHGRINRSIPEGPTHLIRLHIEEKERRRDPQREKDDLFSDWLTGSVPGSFLIFSVLKKPEICGRPFFIYYLMPGIVYPCRFNYCHPTYVISLVP
jgi:hypothetical protein